MMGEGDRERLLHDIQRASYEAVSLADLGTTILPLLDRLFDTSTSLLYRFPETNRIEDIAGSLSESHQEYTQEYFIGDPMQSALRRLDPWLLHAPSVPEYQQFLSHPVHVECATHYGMDNFLHLKLSDHPIGSEGMVGLLLARTSKQPDFHEREKMTLSGLLPSLEALTRRSARLGDQVEKQPFLESMLNLLPYPSLALDTQGSLLWISERAERMLNFKRPGLHDLPEELVHAARRLGSLVKKFGDAKPPVPSLRIPRKDGISLRANLRLCRNANGSPFVIAELEDLNGSPALSEAAARHRLTPAETQVLGLIAEGHSDKEIGKQLFVSIHTVHSHLRSLLAKLGVKSRVKAARIALGYRTHEDDENERT